MTYDENAGTIDVGDRVTAIKKELPVGGGKMKEFPYATSVAGAIDFVMDVNGGKGPNSETLNGKWHDIRSFNGAQFAKSMVCDFEVENLCVKNLAGHPVPVNCSNSSGADYSYCSPMPSGYLGDRWAGAKKACADIDMHLASKDELNTIYTHKGEPNVPTSGWFWSSAENYITTVWIKNFANGDDDIRDKSSSTWTLCVGNN